MHRPPLNANPGVLLLAQDPLDPSNNIAKTINPHGLKRMQFEVISLNFLPKVDRAVELLRYDAIDILLFENRISKF